VTKPLTACSNKKQIWFQQQNKMKTKNGSNTLTRPAQRHASQEVKSPVLLPQVTTNGDGHMKKSSAEQLSCQTEFKFHASEAKCVTVAGDFNEWDAKRTPLKREGDTWKATLDLTHGRYEYRFVVDGNWVSDPDARESVGNPFGSSNSVLHL
jgi:hypothetical protein